MIDDFIGGKHRQAHPQSCTRWWTRCGADLRRPRLPEQVMQIAQR
jgi:hypothetical protein